MSADPRDPVWQDCRHDTYHVVVIGGGVAGLAAATLLARAGTKVLLVEKNPEVGGRAGVRERDGFRWDTGPSWYLMPEVFERFFRQAGTSALRELDLQALDPAYRVWDGPGEPVDVRSGRRHAAALFESREPGAGARLEDYLASGRRVYRLAMRRFLYTSYRGGKDLARAFLAPEVLRAVPRLAPLFARSLHSHVAARFRDPLLRKILDFPAVFLGASPFDTPALYHMMSTLDLDDAVLYPSGGFAAVIDVMRRLAEDAGVQIVTSVAAEAIKASTGSACYVSDPRELAPDRFAGPLRYWLHRYSSSGADQPVVTGVRVRTADGRLRVVPTRAVIAACDTHYVEQQLLRPQWRTYDQSYWDRRTPGPGALVLLLGVRGKLPQLAHHNLLFSQQWQEGFEAIFGARPHLPDPASLYICKPSATDPGVAPQGCENLFVLVPAPADVDTSGGEIHHPGSLGWGTGEQAARAAESVIAQIAHWADIPDLPDRIISREVLTSADYAQQVHAWRGTALGQAHTLRQSAMFRTGNRSAKVRGLFYAGSATLPGIGVPMCLISGELAARAVLDTLPGWPD